jgi:hypothetical protein
MISRRSIITGLGSLVAAPALVRASSLGEYPGHNNCCSDGSPCRVPEFFEYAGQQFNKEYVERGAFLVFGVIAAVIFGVYHARRNL